MKHFLQSKHVEEGHAGGRAEYVLDCITFGARGNSADSDDGEFERTMDEDITGVSTINPNQPRYHIIHAAVARAPALRE